MKKMIIVAAIVCAATFANAAAITWGISAIESSTDVTAAANMAVFFMDGSTYDTLVGKTGTEFGSYAKGNALYTNATKAGRGGAINASMDSGSYDANASVSAYMVLFNTADAADATYYAITSVETQKIPGAGDLAWTRDFASETSGWQKIASTPTPPGPTPDVPEPTSGLLLVLGGAALALRRRR